MLEPPSRQPPVPIRLQFDPSLASRLEASEPLRMAVGQAVERGLAETMACLGIPGQPSVAIERLNHALPHDAFMRVQVNGERCRFSDELPGRVLSYLGGRTLSARTHRMDFLNRIAALADDASSSGENLIEFVSLTCVEVVKQRPAVLFGAAQADVYCASLPAPQVPFTGPWPVDPSGARAILARVLDLRISIADRPAVARVLSSMDQRAVAHITEELIAALRPNVVEILVPRDGLRQMTTSSVALTGELFTFLRDGLFSEVGVRYPRFRFSVAPTLRANSFAFAINHLPTLPLIGLPPDRCLVNDTASSLRRRAIEAEEVTNPATGQRGSLIELTAKTAAEAIDLTTWDQAGYFILCFAAALRKYGACLLNRRIIREQLDQISSPALVTACLAQLSLEQLTHMLRELAAEAVPLNNLRLVLELLVDGDAGFSPIASLRAGLKRQICHKHARGTQTLVVYLLDPPIQAMLEGAAVAETEHDRIAEALKAEIDRLPEMASVPAILTSAKARPHLHAMLSAEFPQMAALSYDELPAGLNVQPIARIALQG